MNDSYHVRLASCADLAAIIAIERECADASHWSESMWQRILAQNDATITRSVWIAEKPEGLLGFAVVQAGAGSAELENLAVKPEARRRGVGKALCEQALSWAAGQRAEEMHLEVRSGNRSALRLYKTLAFIEQRRRASYYRDPVEDAVVMLRTFE